MKHSITTTKRHTIILSGEDITELLGVPEDASVSFDVPGGGDWSNMTIGIDCDLPITVSYTQVEDV